MNGPVLEVRGLEIDFVQYERGLRRRTVHALTGMDLTAVAGEVVALVGASGAGKSLLAHAVLGLLPPNAVERGDVLLDGERLDPAARRRHAGRGMTLLPQAAGFLDPLSPVGRQVRRSAQLAGSADPRRAAADALERRGLGPEVLGRYPHELSGGMARRVLVAMATLGDPRVLIADEPTTGLPPAEVRRTLGELRTMADDGCAVVLITHELRAAVEVAHRVVICRDGRTVDVADPAAFTGDGDALTHPFTRALWQALPGNGFRVAEGV
ncbi:ATP-binding cassette domain-containing protein [Blastococcus goldschmidtiae]|uniref:Nickel import system ATP-binding protein NikD n=1 Tax=Blastococcus goldschmidtiae TaxID=3075546 RepID=A0ABU2K880_9ACTN|nr:ATP-binding cassette domain-containing protein [Blastococcus sp. DSM 46792]MDT0276399.1 ATP-binding cassette domain-containing protein [Blastococcus sp. DSM 46792]